LADLSQLIYCFSIFGLDSSSKKSDEVLLIDDVMVNYQRTYE
jgi:hypothetical protein